MSLNKGDKIVIKDGIPIRVDSNIHDRANTPYQFTGPISSGQYGGWDIRSTNIDGDLIYKDKLIEDHITDKVKEAIEILFGKEKLEEYEKYLNTKNTLSKIDKGDEK